MPCRRCMTSPAPTTIDRSCWSPASPTHTIRTSRGGATGIATRASRSRCRRVTAADVQPDDPHSARLRAAVDAPAAVVTDDHVRAARRAYLGNVSYVDDWTARLVDALDELGLGDDTVVVLLADHGDMLGERGLWFKMSFFEGSARIPLIIHAPAGSAAAGGVTGVAGRRVADDRRADRRRSRRPRRSTRRALARRPVRRSRRGARGGGRVHGRRCRVPDRDDPPRLDEVRAVRGRSGSAVRPGD